MRVLHVIPSIAERYGGPSTAIRGMASALAARGIDVTVAATDGDGPGRMDVPLDRQHVQEGVSYRFFARSVPGEYKFSWPLTRWLRANVRSFDVVHAHALFSYSTLPACRFAFRHDRPVVLRPLGTLGAWSLSHRSWKKVPYLALVERRHLRNAAALHATSEQEAGALAALGYGAKTRIIPLGVPVVEGGLDGEPARPGRAAGATPFRLLFLSRLHPVKNLPVLFDALARIREARGPGIALTVAGDGDKSYVDELRRRVDALGLADEIRFVGRLDGDEKAAAFDSADLFVLPSSHENFGIAAAEALARGVPVVLSRDVGIAPDVEQAGAGCVVAGDASSLASAIAALVESPDRLIAMRRSALALARARFSWNACAASLESLYEEIRRTR